MDVVGRTASGSAKPALGVQRSRNPACQEAILPTPLSHFLVLHGIRPSMAKKKGLRRGLFNSVEKYFYLTFNLLLIDKLLEEVNCAKRERIKLLSTTVNGLSCSKTINIQIKLLPLTVDDQTTTEVLVKGNTDALNF